MWVWVDRLGVLVLDAGVSALVLWAVAVVAMLGSRQPARRLLIARVAAVGSLAFLPLIGLDLVPQYDLSVFFEESGLRFQRLPTPPGPSDFTGAGAGVVWPARVLTLLYLAAIAGGLAWLALGYAVLARVTRGSSPGSPEANELLADLPFPGFRRRPGLRVSARIRRPVLVGFSRALILIPPDLDRPEARDRLRLSLLHELAHAEAGDAWAALLGNLARVFWFFVPPVWWVSSQVRLDQEFLADRRAARGYGPVRDYASSLLDIASARTGASGPEPGPAARAGDGTRTAGSPLFQRFLMLLRCPFPVEPAPPAWWSWGLPWLAVLMTLAVSTVTVRYPSVARSIGPRGHTFRMSRLEIPASAPNPEGRCPVVELPIPLPGQFELTVEVWGDVATLSRMRLAGLPITLPHADPPSGPAGWHIIRLRRSRGETRLHVDEADAAVDPSAPGLTPWLTVEPAPGRPASFQQLTLNW